MKRFFGKKLTYGIGLLLAVCLAAAGCGAGGVQSVDQSGALKVDNPSQMPEIVFINLINHVDSGDDGGPLLQISFVDRNGSYYTCEDFDVCSMQTDELVTAFSAGQLEDKITQHDMTLDVNELFANYQKLCELSENDKLAIIYPEAMPAVEDDRREWYGIYYDQDGKIQTLLIHQRERMTDLLINDERANELYTWYAGLFE